MISNKFQSYKLVIYNEFPFWYIITNVFVLNSSQYDKHDDLTSKNSTFLSCVAPFYPLLQCLYFSTYTVRHGIFKIYRFSVRRLARKPRVQDNVIQRQGNSLVAKVILSNDTKSIFSKWSATNFTAIECLYQNAKTSVPRACIALNFMYTSRKFSLSNRCFTQTGDARSIRFWHWITNWYFFDVHYTIPVGLSLFLALSGQHFLLLKPLCLEKDHWWGSITRNAHMIWSILLIKSDLKWSIHLSRSLFSYFNYLVSVTAGGPVSLGGHMLSSSTVDFGWFGAFWEHQNFPYQNWLKL